MTTQAIRAALFAMATSLAGFLRNKLVTQGWASGLRRTDRPCAVIPVTSSRRRYPWVAPPPRSPLNADLRNALSWADAAYIKVVASGGGLGSVVNYIAHTDCLTILPHTVVFALHRHGSLSALPLELNHPNRTLGLLTPRSIAKMPVIENLTNHLKRRINEMLEQIRQHESAVMKSKFL